MRFSSSAISSAMDAAGADVELEEESPFEEEREDLEPLRGCVGTGIPAESLEPARSTASESKVTPWYTIGGKVVVVGRE